MGSFSIETWIRVRIIRRPNSWPQLHFWARVYCKMNETRKSIEFDHLLATGGYS